MCNIYNQSSYVECHSHIHNHTHTHNHKHTHSDVHQGLRVSTGNTRYTAWSYFKSTGFCFIGQTLYIITISGSFFSSSSSVSSSLYLLLCLLASTVSPSLPRYPSAMTFLTPSFPCTTVWFSTILHLFCLHLLCCSLLFACMFHFVLLFL